MCSADKMHIKVDDISKNSGSSGRKDTSAVTISLFAAQKYNMCNTKVYAGVEWLHVGGLLAVGTSEGPRVKATGCNGIDCSSLF